MAIIKKVSRKYSDIEEFYQKLSSRYPAASLPPLPRKVLFVGECDIRERRAMFDEILRCVSKDAELAGSPELLEFLGTRSPGAADLSSRDFSVLDTDSQGGDDGDAFDFFQQQDRVEGEGLPTLDQKGQDAGKSSEDEAEEALDPLGIMRSKKPKKRPEEVAVKPKPSPCLSIFDEEVDPDEGLFGPGRKPSPRSPAEDAPPRDSLKLFDDPDLGGAVPLGDPLLLPAAHGGGGPTSRPGCREASEELFRPSHPHATLGSALLPTAGRPPKEGAGGEAMGCRGLSLLPVLSPGPLPSAPSMRHRGEGAAGRCPRGATGGSCHSGVASPTASLASSLAAWHSDTSAEILMLRAPQVCDPPADL
ncbi:HCLS1-binding protein 3 isoform X3 [Lagenorhynchus albirostris]|uniref:HCLS1-binding protein 3 isoform X3 n=1 Tax=Lagenorhynchus albirostris TaxID=27610 RepID=UPI0028EF41E1|nr:HCLS1-binding protein 3 isoform X3 [Lagenorhynchus albirostris]